jgi:hypothetical protein
VTSQKGLEVQIISPATQGSRGFSIAIFANGSAPEGAKSKLVNFWINVACGRLTLD